jgi:glycosyltransferase involved in cell wall biosynthesis
MAQQKLLSVINHMDWFWSHRLPLAKGARDAGWDVHVCASGAEGDAKLGENGFTGIALSGSPFKIIADLWRVIGAEKPDLIHVITLKYAFFAGLASRFHSNVRIVHTLAGLGYLFSGEGFKPKLLRALLGPFLKFALKHPRAQIIFQNPDDQALMIKRGFVDPDQVHLIKGSGVDLDDFAHTLEPQNVCPVIVMPTRLVHDKGVAVFIEAAKIVAGRGIDAVFQIAGGPVSNNPLGISKTEINAMVEGAPVEWLGRVSDMPALYAGANLIVYPSYYGEGVPKVLLEAAATGRAIVTTDHAGCREAVDDGKSGILVPVKDVEATAGAIATLIQNATLRAAMGKAARDYAADNFSVGSVVERTLKVYDVANS